METMENFVTVVDPTPSPLPALKDHERRLVLIYDGHCKFCLSNMKLLRKVDGDRLAYVSLHDPIVGQRWPQLTFEKMMSQMHLVDTAGGIFGGAAAMKVLSRKLPWIWFMAPLLHIPGSLPVWQFFYKQVAKIRYRFGRIEDDCDGGCNVHFH